MLGGCQGVTPPRPASFFKANKSDLLKGETAYRRAGKPEAPERETGATATVRGRFPGGCSPTAQPPTPSAPVQALSPPRVQPSRCHGPGFGRGGGLTGPAPAGGLQRRCSIGAAASTQRRGVNREHKGSKSVPSLTGSESFGLSSTARAQPHSPKIQGDALRYTASQHSLRFFFFLKFN